MSAFRGVLRRVRRGEPVSAAAINQIIDFVERGFVPQLGFANSTGTATRKDPSLASSSPTRLAICTTTLAIGGHTEATFNEVDFEGGTGLATDTDSPIEAFDLWGSGIITGEYAWVSTVGGSLVFELTSWERLAELSASVTAPNSVTASFNGAPFSVELDWMAQTSSLASGDEVLVRWFPSSGEWVIVAAECEVV